MHDANIAGLIQGLSDFFRLDRLSDTTLVILGILVGLVAKNLYTVAMRSFGFVGSFLSRLLIGWWEEFRRETPNVMDFAMAVVADCEGEAILLMDPLIGPRRLNDVYLNPRTAFGVRLQTFATTVDRPWVHFRIEDKPGLVTRLSQWRRWLRHRAVTDGLSPRERLMLKYRRVYAPIENLVGQYMTNQWAAQMAIGEPCHVFRFIVVLVYEKNAASHVDRHFRALVIWEELLRHDEIEKVVIYQPEYRHRWETLKRIGEHYRTSQDAAAEFGSLLVMVPKRTLLREYLIHWTASATGELVPVSRPAPTPDAVAAHTMTFGALKTVPGTRTRPD